MRAFIADTDPDNPTPSTSGRVQRHEHESTPIPSCPCEAESKSENKRMNIIILTTVIFIFPEKNILYRKQIVKLTIENEQLKKGRPCPDLPAVTSESVELVTGTGIFVNRDVLKRITVHRLAKANLFCNLKKKI